MNKYKKLFIVSSAIATGFLFINIYSSNIYNKNINKAKVILKQQNKDLKELETIIKDQLILLKEKDKRINFLEKREIFLSKQFFKCFKEQNNISFKDNNSSKILKLPRLKVKTEGHSTIK